MFWNWVVGRVFNYNSYYSMLVCANYGHRAGGLGNKEMARLGGWRFAKFKTGAGNHPPIPPVAEKQGACSWAG